jgi:hypothetical protein
MAEVIRDAILSEMGELGSHLYNLGIGFEIRVKKLPKGLKYSFGRIKNLVKYLEKEFERKRVDLIVPMKEDRITPNYNEPKIVYEFKSKRKSSIPVELLIISTIYVGEEKYKSSIKLIIPTSVLKGNEAEKIKELGFQGEGLLIKCYEFQDSKREKYDIEKLGNKIIKTYRKVIKVKK